MRGKHSGGLVLVERERQLFSSKTKTECTETSGLGSSLGTGDR